MELKLQTSKEYFRSLMIVHAALLAGQVIFLFISFFLNASGLIIADSGDLDRIFTIVVPLFVLAGITTSLVLTKTRLTQIREKGSLNEKLTEYRSAFIVKLALLEGPSFLAIVCYLLTANPLFLGLAVFMIVLFFINRPTREKVSAELELHQHDIDLIDKPDSVITD